MITGFAFPFHSVFNSIPDGTLHQIGEGLRKKSVNDPAHPLLTQQHDDGPAPVHTPTFSHVPLLFEGDEEVSGRGLVEKGWGQSVRISAHLKKIIFYRNFPMCPPPTLRQVLCPPQQILSPLSCYPLARRCLSRLPQPTVVATSPVLRVCCPCPDRLP